MTFIITYCIDLRRADHTLVLEGCEETTCSGTSILASPTALVKVTRITNVNSGVMGKEEGVGPDGDVNAVAVLPPAFG